MALKTTINQLKYDKDHIKRINLKLNINYDADILDKLSKVGNMQGYIKSLIREDIKKEDH